MCIGYTHIFRGVLAHFPKVLLKKMLPEALMARMKLSWPQSLSDGHFLADLYQPDEHKRNVCPNTTIRITSEVCPLRDLTFGRTINVRNGTKGTSKDTNSFERPSDIHGCPMDVRYIRYGCPSDVQRTSMVHWVCMSVSQSLLRTAPSLWGRREGA